MIIYLLLTLAITAPAFATRPGYNLNPDTFFFSYDQLDEFKQQLADEHDQAKSLPYAQKLFTILEKSDATEAEIFSHLFDLKPEQISALEPLQADLKKLIKPAFRKKIHAYIDLQRKGSFEKPEVERVCSIKSLLSFEKSTFKTGPDDTFFPAGRYKTDQGWMVDIDHEEVAIGQQTRWGKIVAINR